MLDHILGYFLALMIGCILISSTIITTIIGLTILGIILICKGINSKNKQLDNEQSKIIHNKKANKKILVGVLCLIGACIFLVIGIIINMLIF